MTEKESLIPKELVVGSTFVLLFLLTLPTSMVLSFRASSYERAAFPAKVAEVRKDYFDQLAAKVNQLAHSLNYSAGEKYALYRGTGQKVEPDYYPSAPWQSTGGLYPSDYYGPDPFKDLRENWVQVGKLIRRSTGNQFQFLPGNYVVNGTHCALVQSHKPGSKQEDRLVVNYQTLRPIGYFFWQLEQHAHDRRLTKEELRANWDPTATEADAFQAALTGAFRSKNRGEAAAARQAFTRAVTRFNDFTAWLELDLYQATMRLNQRTRKLMFQIGRYGYQSFPVQGSKNQTEADYYSFEETLRYLGGGQFKVLKGYERLSYPERQPMTAEELFTYLRAVAREYGNPRAASASTAATTNDDSVEGFLTTTQDPFVGGSGYSAASYFPTGDLNEPSYNSWDDGLLAVAVVLDPSDSHSNLKDLLSKALEEDVWGFMDAYSFGPYGNPSKSWKSELLAEDTVNLRKYDVLFLDDYCVDSWDSSWSLTLREKQLLAEWIYNGGSIYLSSAVSNDLSTSVVKDQFFPAEWLTMLTTSTVLGGGFGHSVDHAWDIYTDTPEAAPYEIGEFAYNDTTQGLIPGCLSLGVIEQEDHSTGWVLDSRNNDKLVSISQTVTVPDSFAQAYFSLDYKKLTGLEDDSLEVLLLDEDNNLVYQQVLVEHQSMPDTRWQTTGKLRLTEQLRAYAGQSLDLYLRVAAGDDCLLEDGPDFTNYIYSFFLCDNLHLSFAGSNGMMVPVLVYHDEELMNEVDAADYGAWLTPSETTGKSSPYYQTDSYNSRYFADHLTSQLAREGFPNVQKVSTAEVLNYLAFNEPAIIIPAHPFPESIYNGEPDCPLLNWVKESGGVVVDQQSEPLSYFFSSEPGSSSPPVDWWDTAWAYRQELTIDNPNGEALMDYQVMLELTPSNFEYSHCQADGSDLRFIDDETNTTFPYWIEAWEPFGTSKVWVKVPTIPSAGITMALYYGNPQVTAKSDPLTTFDHYVNFTVGLNSVGSGQDATPSQYEVLDNGRTLHLWGNNWKYLDLLTNVPSGGSLIVEVEMASTDNGELQGVGITNNSGSADSPHTYIFTGSQSWGLTPDQKYSGAAGDWQTVSAVLDDFSGAFNYFIFTNDDDADASGDVYFKDIRLRKYAASKPTAMLLGSEEGLDDSSGEGGSGGSEEDWWNASWNYRRELSIENPTTEPLTNYQVSFEFSPSNFDYSRANEFGDDLRFIDGSNNELFYWLERWDTDGISKVWVNVPTLPADGTSITMYYGNDQAVAQSDGASTFYHYVSFVPSAVKSLGSQDGTFSQFEVSEFGRGLHLWGNNWKYVDLSTTIPSDGSLLLELTMSSTDNGELQGVGISTINNGADSSHTYIFTGSQSWGLTPDQKYSGAAGDWQTVSAVLDDFSGTFNYFIFTNDDDADASGDVWFKDIRIRKYAATEPTVTMQEEEEYQPPSLPSTAKYYLHRKDQVDLAILNYDLFQSVFSAVETEPQVAFWSENFDDKQSSLEVVEPVISIALANSLGGYVKVEAPSEQPQPFYHAEQTTITPVEVQADLLFHADVYVDGTGSTELFVEANNTQGEAVTLRCTLGEDNEWYVSSGTNTFHMFIPFDDLEHPSELEPGYWNSLLLNLGYLSAASDSELDTIKKVGFVCEGNLTAFDNFWIGYAGSTQQTPAEWLVTPLTPFTSDYPLSISVLQQMNQELPGFDFKVFGESIGARELLFKDEFKPDYLPDDDRWTEPPIDQWLLNGEEVAFTSDYNYTGSHSLNWNATSATSGTITLSFAEPQTIRDYPTFTFSLLANTSLALEDWTNSYPSVVLRDFFGATLSFDLEEEFGYEWTSLTLTLDDGTATGTFNRSCLSEIDFVLPERTAANYRVYLDDLHFIKGLSSDVWSWEGQIEVVAGLLKLMTDDSQTATWVKVKDQFGLGELSFLGTIRPGTQTQFGLFGEEEGDGSAYFHYSGSESYWWNNGWSNRQRVTITSPTTLYNYPVYLEIPYHQGMNSDYSDLRFISGVTPLPYEFVVTNDQQAVVWLKLPKLSPTTTIHLYYNNSEVSSSGENSNAVWDSGYDSVLHLDETSGFHEDSTGNSNYASNQGSNQDAEGIIAGANDFDGIDDALKIYDDPSLDYTTTLTLEAWVYPEGHDAGTKDTIISKSNPLETPTPDYSYELGIGDDQTVYLDLSIGGMFKTLETEPNSIAFNTWNYVAGTFDGTTMRLFINGTLVAERTVSGTIATNDLDVFIGNNAYTGTDGLVEFDGRIDEVRLSHIPRSSSWIRECYQQIIKQQTVVLFGSIESNSETFVTHFLEEDGSPLNTWEKYNAGNSPHSNHILAMGPMDVYRGGTKVDTNVTAIRNEEGGSGTYSCQLLARAPVDLTGWDGVSDIPIEFTFRATSGYDDSSVTNFRLRFYDSSDNAIPNTGFGVAQNNREGQTWISGYDSGWQTVNYNLPAVELAPYEGQTIYVAFGHGDGWNYNWQQRTYLDYLLIGTAQGSSQSAQNNQVIGSITSPQAHFSAEEDSTMTSLFKSESGWEQVFHEDFIDREPFPTSQSGGDWWYTSNSQYVTTDIVDFENKDQLYFEYDGDIGGPIPYGEHGDSIKQTFDPVNNFSLMIPVKWWGQSSTSVRRVIIQLLNGGNIIGEFYIWHDYTDSACRHYQIRTDSGTIEGADGTPTIGFEEFILKGNRFGSSMTLSIEDDSGQTLVSKTYSCSTPLNGINIKHKAIFGTEMEGWAPWSSHSKTWINYVDIQEEVSVTSPDDLGWHYFYDDTGDIYDNDYYSALSENGSTWDWSYFSTTGIRENGYVTFNNYLTTDANNLFIAGRSKFSLSCSLTYVNESVDPFGFATRIHSTSNTYAMIKYYPDTEHLVFGLSNLLQGAGELSSWWITKTTIDFTWEREKYHTLTISIDLGDYIRYSVDGTVKRASTTDISYCDLSFANEIEIVSDTSNSYIRFDCLKTGKYSASPPSSPTYSSIGVHTVIVSWEEIPSSLGYKLYGTTDIYGSPDESAWRVCAQTSDTSIYLTGLSANTTYWFRYTAFNRSAESDYSPSSSLTTDELPLPLSPSQVPTFVYVTSHSVTVKWQPTDYTEYYKLYWATEDQPDDWSLYCTTSNLQQEITELQANTTYYFKYVAVNTAGESAESPVGTVTTSAPAYYEAQLLAVVSDGTTTQIQELVFTGGFNPTLPHKYTITRQENLIQFFIDDKLVAEFSESLPVYDPSDPKHHPKIVVEKGVISFETIQYRENEHAVLAGDILYDDFTDRSPFPTTVVGGDDWWYVPDKNSPEVTTDIVNYANRDQLSFEYSSTGTVWEMDAIEQWFTSVTDFELTMPLEWLGANAQAGWQFNLYLYHYAGGDYTLLGRTALIDSWDSHAGSYYVQAGTQESRYLSAPLSGEAVMTIDRTGSTLTTTIKDSNDQVILRQTDEESTLTANCLRLEFQGIWNEEVKLWIDSLSLEGALPGSAGTAPAYHFEGDSYADPAAITYGNGWLCFVKNTPLKPLTVNSATEVRTTTDWLTHIIRFFADKIEPSYEFYWNTPSEAAYTPPVGTTAAYAYGGELGQQWMTFPYNVHAIDMPFAGGVPSMVLPRFYSQMGLEPQLGFVDPSNFLSLDEGRVDHWLLNTYAAQGASYPYPDLAATGTKEGSMLYGSTLFRTTFDPAHWQYDFNQDGTVNALDNWQFIPFKDEQGGAPPSDWWNTNWTYRQPLTIENTNDESLTNYQVLLTISDFPYEHAQPNGEDLRFLDESNNLLDYWITDWLGPAGESQVWLELPSISAGATKEIMMYYGNTQALPLSNAETTFDQYVHFPSNLTDQGIGGGQDSTPNHYSVLDDGRTLHLWGNNWKYVDLSTTIPSDGSFILEFEMSSTDNGELQGVGISTINDGADSSHTYIFTGSQSWGLTPDQKYSGAAGDWQTVSAVLDDFSGTFNYFIFTNDDDADASGDVYFKDVRLRKYVQNELSVTAGEEEELPPDSSWQTATTGMLYSNLTDAYSLQLDRYSLLPDPFFFGSETLGTNTSVHTQFYEKYAGGATDDPTNQTKMGLDSTGLPVTSAFFYKGGSDDDGTWANEMYLGTGFDPQELEEMKNYGVTDWHLEFDYWVSQTTAGDPCSLAIKVFVPTDDSRVTNPLDSEDLAENFTQAGTTHYHALYNEEEQFDHYGTTALSSTLTNDVPSSKAQAFVFLQLTLDGNENQTAYIDNLRLTPSTQYHTPGVGSGYRLRLNGSLPANDYFDPLTDAKVVHYPFVYLDEVFSADSCTSEEVAGSKDYEFVVQLFDPTTNKTIRLHYFWSDDGTVYSKEQEQEYSDGAVIVTDDRLDFYLQREEQLNGTIQLLQLDLLEGLNRLVQVSGIPIDREHTVHTLNMTLSLDDAATHLQIGSLAIEGVAPWKKEGYDGSRYYCHPNHFLGEVQGKSEITVLGTVYLWSEVEQTVKLQVWSPPGASPSGGITQVYLNGQFANAVDPANPGEAYDEEHPPTEEVKLIPGVNRLQVRVQNSKDGAPFKVRLLDLADQPPGQVYLLNQSYRPHCYPLVSGNIGNGLVSFMGFDDNALSEPFDDDPLLPFLTNLLLHELEHRNLEYQTVKQTLMSVLEYSLEHKHQDLAFDWENSDDPFPAISDDDPFEIFDELVTIKQEVAKYFGKVMTASRTPTGEELTVAGKERLNSLLSKLFHAAKMTGTDTYDSGTDSYWYPEAEGLLWEGTSAWPTFPELSRKQCVSVYDNQGFGGMNYRHFFFVRHLPTDYSTDGVAIRLYSGDFAYDGQNPPAEVGSAYHLGEFRIFSGSEVYVDDAIDSPAPGEGGSDYEVYLESSGEAHSLLTVLNATLYSINHMIPFKEETSNERTMDFFLDLFPEDSSWNIPFTDYNLGLGRNVHGYVDNVKRQLFLESYSEAYSYYSNLLSGLFIDGETWTPYLAGLGTAGLGTSLAAMVATKGSELEDDEEIIVEEETTDEEDLTKPKEKTKATPEDMEIKLGSIIPGLSERKASTLYTYSAKGNEFGVRLKKSDWNNWFFQLLQPMGELVKPKEDKSEGKFYQTGSSITNYFVDLMAKMLAIERADNNQLPNDDGYLELDSWATTAPVVLMMNDKSTPGIDQYATLRTLGPNSEGLFRESQSILDLGMYRTVTYTPTYNPSADAPGECPWTLLMRTEMHIDRDQFSRAIYEIMHDQDSPYYHGGLQADKPIKLKELTKSANGEEIIYQVVVYEHDGDGNIIEVPTDMLVKKSKDFDPVMPNEPKVRYDLYFYQGNPQTSYYKSGGEPHGDNIVFLSLADDQAAEALLAGNVDDLPEELKTFVKKFDFRKNHPYYHKMKAKAEKSGNSKTFLQEFLNFHRVPLKDRSDPNNPKNVYAFHLSNAKTIITEKGEAKILEGNEAMDETLERQETEYHADVGILSLAESVHKKNNYLVISQFHTGETIGYQMYSSISQYNMDSKHRFTGSDPKSVISSFLLFPLVYKEIAEFEALWQLGESGNSERTIKKIVEKYATKAFNDALDQLRTFFGGEKIKNGELKIAISEGLRELAGLKIEKRKMNNNLFKCTKMLDWMPFDIQNNMIGHIKKNDQDIRLLKAQSKKRTMVHREMLKYIETQGSIQDAKIMVNGGLEYQMETRLPGIFKDTIAGKAITIDTVIDYDGWLNSPKNNHIAWPFFGRTPKSYSEEQLQPGSDYAMIGDIPLPKFSPLALCHKLFTYILNEVLPKNSQDEVEGPIYDEKGEPLSYNSWSTGRFLTRYSIGGEIVFGPGHATAPQLSAVRWALTGLADQIATTKLIPNERNKPLVELMNQIKLRAWVHKLASENDYLEIVGFSSNRRPLDPLAENLQDHLSRFVDVKSELNYPHSFISAANLDKESDLLENGFSKDTYMRNLAQTVAAIPIFSSIDSEGAIQAEGSLTLLQLLLNNLVRVEIASDGTRHFYKEYSYYDKDNEKWKEYKKKLGEDDFEVIGLDYLQNNPIKPENLYVVSEQDGNYPNSPEDLLQGKIWIPQFSETTIIPVVNFYRPELRIVLSSMGYPKVEGPNGDEVVIKDPKYSKIVGNYQPTEKDMKSFWIDTLGTPGNIINSKKSFASQVFSPGLMAEDRKNIAKKVNQMVGFTARFSDASFVRRSDSIIGGISSTLNGYRPNYNRELYRLQGKQFYRELARTEELLTTVKTFMKTKSIEVSDQVLIDYFNALAGPSNRDVSDPTTSTRYGIDPTSNALLTGAERKLVNPKNLNQFMLGVGVTTLGQTVIQGLSLGSQVKQQFWQSKLIEFFMHSAKLDTVISNLLTAKDVNGNHNYTDPGDSRGKYVDWFTDPQDGNKTAYKKGLIYSASVWATDYVEVGPADIFEYINGFLAGRQLGLTMFGMEPICQQLPTTVANGLLGYAQELTGVTPPDWLANGTQVLSHPAFRAYWQVYLFLAGSMISVVTQLLKTASFATIIGGVVSTAMSLVASSIVQQVWSEVNQATASYLWQTNNQYHWTTYAKGDKNMAWKIKAYDLATWTYNLGRSFRPSGWLAEVFYLSTYYPEIGVWAGPLDSLLPFVVLTSVGVGLIAYSVSSVVTASLLSTVAAGAIATGALFAGVGALVVAAAIALTFVVAAVLKACGLFKKRNPSEEGDP